MIDSLEGHILANKFEIKLLTDFFNNFNEMHIADMPKSHHCSRCFSSSVTRTKIQVLEATLGTVMEIKYRLLTQKREQEHLHPR